MFKTFKVSISLLGMAFVLVAATFSLVSCDKNGGASPNMNNPKAEGIPAASFSVKICEEEPGICRDSVYRFFADITSSVENGMVPFTSVQGRVGGKQGPENDSTRAGRDYSENGKDAWKTKVFSVFEGTNEPDVVELVVTPWNTISFEMTADVNASSSDACIDVVKKDARHYVLKAKSTGTVDGKPTIQEGTSMIRFWNGNEPNTKEIKILVRAASSIPCEGFLLRVTTPGAMGDMKTFFYELKETPGKSLRSIPDPDWFSRYSEWNIAELSDVYDRNWREKTGNLHDNNFSPEKCYFLEKLTTLEFVGTIPRNATPDNDITQIYDLLCHEHLVCCNSRVAYGRRSYDDYRWLPVLGTVQKSTINYGPEKIENSDEKLSGLPNEYYPVLIDGTFPQHFHPADLRYRKAKVWATNDGYKYQANSLGYSVNGKTFWGYFYNNNINTSIY